MSRKAIGPNTRRVFAIMLLAGTAPLAAQTPPAPEPPGSNVATPEETPPADPNAPPPSQATPAVPQGTRSFTPADFARFAPRTALDMLNNVPGFSIDAGTPSGGSAGRTQCADQR